MVMLLLWLVLIPTLLGMPLAELVFKTDLAEGRKRRNICAALLCGYMELWALFQLIAVAFIVTTGNFNQVVSVFTAVSLAGTAAAVVWLVWRAKKQVCNPFCFPWKLQNPKERTAAYMKLAVWCLFFLIAGYQLIQSSCMAFADGDDAFYIPVSSYTEASGTMYRTIPYTGETTQLDTRHGLAPFPIWIAFLSRVSGIHATILAQSVLGGVLLLLGYMIYYQIAQVLFTDRKEGIPYFMLLVSILMLFGNYSFYTAETFLMTRTSQGKAVLAGLILPFLLLCLLLLMQEYSTQHKKAEKGKRKLWISVLLMITTAAAWLCSSLGTFLCAALIGVSCLIMALVCRNYRILLRGVVCALPSALFAVFYFLLQ